MPTQDGSKLEIRDTCFYHKEYLLLSAVWGWILEFADARYDNLHASQHLQQVNVCFAANVSAMAKERSAFADVTCSFVKDC